MSTGSSAQEFYEWLVRRHFVYAVSRADVCVDTVDPEAFERLIHYQKGFVNQNKMKQVHVPMKKANSLGLILIGYGLNWNAVLNRERLSVL